METVFINHLKRLSVIKNNQESNCRGRENGRESAMSTNVITCHLQNPGHKLRNWKRKLESKFEIEKSGKFNNEIKNK